MTKSRKRLFDHDTPFKLSRAKIDLFLECPCCFYLDRKLGVAPPGGPPFTLNNAVDELWKDEFDVHRAAGTPHPIAVKNYIKATPFQHEKIDDWRNNRRGLTYLHEPTQLLVSGALDEIWVTPDDKLIVVDVKATSKQSEVNLDADWQISYKRQMEIYQWLLERNGFTVSKIGYFIYCNGRRDDASNGMRLAFDVKVIPYEGDHAWIEPTLYAVRSCLTSDKLPIPNSHCKMCRYRHSVTEATLHNPPGNPVELPGPLNALGDECNRSEFRRKA